MTTDVAEDRDRELERERAYVDAAWNRLVELRDRAGLVATTAGARLDPRDMAQDSLFERDVAVAHAAHRAASLDIARDRLCVGRIDGDLAGETDTSLVIGRTSVSDTDGEPMIVDWRAPAAAAFYRASPGDRLGVRRRRHFRWHAGALVGLDDDVLDRDVLDDDSVPVIGEGALLAALEAPRTGRMIDIVGTIQADQDRIIRRTARGVTIVEGGPGTGKTAVALHRAAYLLYELAARGDQTAVCFVGPNRTFLRYVGDVVPSLGEDQIVLATPEDFGPAVTVTGRDEPEAARVKGDRRMVEFLTEALRGFEQPLAETAEIACGRFVLRIGPDETARIVDEVRSVPGTHQDRRRELLVRLRRELADQYRGRLARDERATARGRSPKFADVIDKRGLRLVLDRMWPPLTAERFLGSVLTDPERVRNAARGLFDEAEADTLVRSDPTAWTAADIALLDEVTPLVGGTRATDDGVDDAGHLAADSLQLLAAALDEEMEAALEDRRPDCPNCELELTFGRSGSGELQFSCTNFTCGGTWPAYEILGDAQAQMLGAVIEELADRYADVFVQHSRVADRSFSHVIVDEAQEISVMQWRAIARRCPTTSFTVAGDLDQASAPGALRSWAVVEELARAAKVDCETVRLTVSYRTPAEVMEFAADLVARYGGSVAAPTSVRHSGVEPTWLDDLDLDALRAGLRAEVGASGTIAVVVPDAIGGPDVITAAEAKGLEFDGVAVVRPDLIAAGTPTGPNQLYVALTRTTRHLWVAGPRPED